MTDTRPGPQIALQRDFLPAFSRLPKRIQKKVWEFLDKFQHTPTRSGINFERLQGAVDPKVRSVRIDQAYRAIVIHPPKGDVYLIVWVDHHDDAYQWVRNRKFEVNPTTGTFQVFSEVPAAELTEEAAGAETPIAAPAATPPTLPKPAAATAGGLFANTDPEHLLLAGVPRPLLPAVLAVADESGLDTLLPHLPEDAADALVGMAAGMTVFEAIDQLEEAKAKPEAVDTEDFAAALARPQSKRKFAVVEKPSDLEQMLEAPLEQWRVFLHPSQRSIVERDLSGPGRVLGGAGTGKTVVLLHRARHLARKVFTAPTDKILVTTFTRNLALDLEHNLRNLCGPETDRIEVTNLHAWAARYLRGEGGRAGFPPTSSAGT